MDFWIRVVFFKEENFFLVVGQNYKLKGGMVGVGTGPHNGAMAPGGLFLFLFLGVS